MKNRKLWAIAIAVVLLGSGLALAPAVNQTHCAEPPGAPGPQRVSPFAQLNLTADQQQKLNQVKADFAAKTADLRTNLQAKMAELNTLWGAANLDESQIVAKAHEVAQLQSQLAEFRLQQRIATFEILTPDQRKQLMAGFAQGHRAWHNQGGRPSQDTK